MAARTYAQIYNDALQEVDETSGSGATTAKAIIKAGINESYSQAAGLRNWKTLESSKSLTTTNGTAEYTPVTSSASTPRIRRIISILDQTNNKYIKEIERSVFEKSYPFVDPTVSGNLGNPRLWYESGYSSARNMKVTFYQIPNSALTLLVRYFFEPLALVNDTDIPLIPDQYHYGLGYWAIAKYFEFQREGISNYYRQLHQSWIADMLSAEYGPVVEAPQIEPVTRANNYIIGKIGRIYN